MQLADTHFFSHMTTFDFALFDSVVDHGIFLRKSETTRFSVPFDRCVQVFAQIFQNTLECNEGYAKLIQGNIKRNDFAIVQHLVDFVKIVLYNPLINTCIHLLECKHIIHALHYFE